MTWLFLWAVACQGPNAGLDDGAARSGLDSGMADTAASQGSGGGTGGSDGGATDSAASDTPTCGPRVEGEANHTEGDVVTFSVSCSSDEDPGSFSAEVVNLPVGAAFDDAGWAFQWQTGLADGARYDLLVSVTHVDGGFPETVMATFWVADDGAHADNVAVVPATYTEEWGLPVMHLKPQFSVDQTYRDATCTFDGVEYPCEMKIRGATSAYYPKPGYTLRFPEEHIDLSERGLQRKDHLVLISTFDDNSYVRQKFCYDLWQAMADHAGVEGRMLPRTFFTVIYIETEYVGLFVAIDRIDDEFADEMGIYRDSNLYKAISHDANFYLKNTLYSGYEKKEGTPEDGESGAYWDLEDLVEFTGSTDADTFWAEADSWIRTDEFMDWLLFVQFSLSSDSAGKNSYLYNDPDNWEFRYVPWDFNHSWGQDWMTLRTDSEDWSDYRSTNAIFDHFQANEEADALLWERWASLVEAGPLHGAWLEATLDSYYDLIGPSAERDWDMWGGDYYVYGGWASYRNYYGDWQDYEGEKDYLYQWVSERAAWADTAH
jgi:spore coat protein H